MKYAMQLLFFFFGTLALAADPENAPSMAANSPFSDYTAGVVVYVLMAAVLVATLLIGGLLVVHFGFMAKRPEDRVGGRTPSDVGTLQGNAWPDDVTIRKTLPASDLDTDIVTEEIPDRRVSSAPTEQSQSAEVRKDRIRPDRAA